jgi:glycoprotein endo-alpha-1,2-mannosidase
LFFFFVLARGVVEQASRQGMTCAWHLEPYPGRSAASVMDDVAYLEATYGASLAVAREGADRRDAIYFVYDSYHVSAHEWRAVLTAGDPGSSSSSSSSSSGAGRRGRAARGVFVGLWLERGGGEDLARGGFDAFYTYFASRAFAFGASPQHWPKMVRDAKQLGLAAVLSVGPGYDDARIRPWNAHNAHARQGGTYYAAMCRAAIDARPDALSVTSYNEWCVVVVVGGVGVGGKPHAGPLKSQVA